VLTENSLYFKIIQEHKPSVEDLNKKRQNILSELQKMLNAPIISYIANIMHPFSAMQQSDVDVMINFIQQFSGRSKKMYIIIESPGGDINVAIKIVKMLRAAFPEGFSIIVPNIAKSAATMLVLGADEVIMGPSSELGPIDPQIIVLTGNPQQPTTIISARFIVNFFKRMKDEVSVNPNLISVYYPLAQQFRPDLIMMAEEAIEMAKLYAKGLLKQGLMKGATDREVDEVVGYLSGEKHPTLHDSPITYDMVRSLRLNVIYWGQDDLKWIKVLEYYFRAKALFQLNPNIVKLFETPSESIMQQVQIMQMPQQTQQSPQQSSPATTTKP